MRLLTYVLGAITVGFLGGWILESLHVSVTFVWSFFVGFTASRWYRDQA